MDTLWTYRKKKSFRYIKIDKKKEELQANLQKKKQNYKNVPISIKTYRISCETFALKSVIIWVDPCEKYRHFT